MAVATIQDDENDGAGFDAFMKRTAGGGGSTGVGTGNASGVDPTKQRGSGGEGFNAFMNKKTGGGPSEGIKERTTLHTPGTVETVTSPTPLPTPAPIPSALGTDFSIKKADPIVKKVETIAEPPIEPPIEEPVVDPIEEPVDTVTGPDTGTTPRGTVDFTETLGQAQDIKSDEIQAALKQEAVDRQNIKNAFSHLAAQGRDSGFVNAKNMASIRNAALLRGDAVTAANMKFSNEAMSIAKEKAVSDASFDREQYLAEAETWSSAITGMIENGDIDGAIELAGSLSEDFPQFAVLSNPTYQAYLNKKKDENLAAQYTEIRKGIIDMALNPGEGQQLNETRGNIIRQLSADTDMGAGFILDYFGTIPVEEYSTFGIDDADAQIIKEFQDGTRDFNDLAVQEVFLDAYIGGTQTQAKINAGRESFGPLYAKYEGNDVATGIMDAIVDDNFGTDGVIQVGEDFITIYDGNVTLDNIESTFVFDAMLTDWDFDPYTDGNSKIEASDDPVDGLEEFTNAELDEMYTAYHNKMKKEYAGINNVEDQLTFRNNLMNQSAFKENLMQLKNDGSNKDQMKNDITSSVSSGTTAGTFTNAQGEEVNYSDFGVDISKFAGDGVEAVQNRETIEALINGESPSNTLIELLDDKDPSILLSMANKGVFLKDNRSPTDPTYLKLDNGLSPSSANNIFTGANMEGLLGELDDNNQTIVYMGGAPYRVTAEPGYRDLAGEGTANLPVINWTVLAIGGDEEKAQTFQGQITYGDGEYLKARDAGGYAKQVLDNKKLDATKGGN